MKDEAELCAKGHNRMDYSGFKKVISLFTTLAFVFTSVAVPEPASAQSASPISLAPVEVQDLVIPPEIASLEERFESREGAKGRTVIAIQDAHGVYDAQKNIRALIQELQDRYGFELVGLEGGAGRADHTFLRTFPDKEINRQIADQYMKRAELSGGEVAAIVNPKAGIFYGIENRELYFENRNFFLKALELRDKNLHILNLLTKKLDRIRDEIFPPELISFHKIEQKYLKGYLPLWEFMTALFDETERQGLLLQEKYPNAWLIFQAIAAARKGGKKEEMAAKEKELTAKIEGRVLFEEIEALSREIKNALSFSRASGNDSALDVSTLLSFYDKLRVLHNLASLEIMREDWANYQANKKDFDQSAFADFLGKYKSSIDLALELAPAERFYEDAIQRDRALFENLIHAMKKESRDRAILVTGGFHSAGLAELMQKENISYVIYTPRIEHLEEENPYFRVMQGEVSYRGGGRTSIQAILATGGLAGEKRTKEFLEAFARGGLEALAKKMTPGELEAFGKHWIEEIVKNVKTQGALKDPGPLIDFAGRLIKEMAAKKTGVDQVAEMLAELETAFREIVDPRARKQVEAFIQALRTLLNSLEGRPLEPKHLSMLFEILKSDLAPKRKSQMITNIVPMSQVRLRWEDLKVEGKKPDDVASFRSAERAGAGIPYLNAALEAVLAGQAALPARSLGREQAVIRIEALATEIEAVGRQRSPADDLSNFLRTLSSQLRQNAGLARTREEDSSLEIAEGLLGTLNMIFGGMDSNPGLKSGLQPWFAKLKQLIEEISRGTVVEPRLRTDAGDYVDFDPRTMRPSADSPPAQPGMRSVLAGVYQLGLQAPRKRRERVEGRIQEVERPAMIVYPMVRTTSVAPGAKPQPAAEPALAALLEKLRTVKLQVEPVPVRVPSELRGKITARSPPIPAGWQFLVHGTNLARKQWNDQWKEGRATLFEQGEFLIGPSGLSVIEQRDFETTGKESVTRNFSTYFRQLRLDLSDDEFNRRNKPVQIRVLFYKNPRYEQETVETSLSPLAADRRGKIEELIAQYYWKNLQFGRHPVIPRSTKLVRLAHVIEDGMDVVYYVPAEIKDIYDRQVAALPGRQAGGRSMGAFPTAQEMARLDPKSWIGEKLWNEFIRLNKKKEPRILNFSGTFGEVLARNEDLEDIPKDQYVLLVVNRQSDDEDFGSRLDHTVIIDQAGRIRDRYMNILMGKTNLGEFAYQFSMSALRSDEVTSKPLLLMHEIALLGQFEGKGLASQTFKNIVSILEKKYPGVEIGADALSPVVAHWFLKYFRGKLAMGKDLERLKDNLPTLDPANWKEITRFMNPKRKTDLRSFLKNAGENYPGAPLIGRVSRVGRAGKPSPKVQPGAPTAARSMGALPFEVDYSEFKFESDRLLIEALLADQAFLRGSIQKIFPELQNEPIQKITPRWHLGKGKSIFEVPVRFSNGEERTLLFIASNEDRTDLAQKYKAVVGKDPAHEFTHRFGAETSAQVPRGPITEKYHVFSLDFHPGVTLDYALLRLERLAGVPGHPGFKGRLEEMKREDLEKRLADLMRLGLLTEENRAGILSARDQFDATKDEQVISEAKAKLQDLIFRLDQAAVEAQFRFYRRTGFVQNDPRRNNLIFRVVDGAWTFRPIDYESMEKTASSKDAIYVFDIFESKFLPGFIDGTVRPWAWTYTEDKTGFFEAILKAYGEEEGIRFLQQARDELRASNYSTDQIILKYLRKFLSDYLKKMGARQEEPVSFPAAEPGAPIPDAQLLKRVEPGSSQPPGGLCVTGDTLLPVILSFPPRKRVTLIPIREVRPGDQVLSLNEATGRIEPHRINALLDMGVKPVYRLTTASGRSIKTTSNHPYLGMQNGHSTWVKISELRVGDKIAVPDEINAGAFYDRVHSRFSKLQQIWQRLHLQSTSQSFLLSSFGIEEHTKCSKKDKAGQQSELQPNSARSIEEITGQSHSENGFAHISQKLRNVFLKIIVQTFHCETEGIIIINNNQYKFDYLLKSAYADEIGPGTDILWDPIVSIEYVGREQVWDIEVEGTHNFIGNGIFAHNTFVRPPPVSPTTDRVSPSAAAPATKPAAGGRSLGAKQVADHLKRLGFRAIRLNLKGKSTFEKGPFRIFLEVTRDKQLKMNVVHVDPATKKMQWLPSPRGPISSATVGLTPAAALTLKDDFGLWTLDESGYVSFSHLKNTLAQNPYLEPELKKNLEFLAKKGGYQIFSFGTAEEPFRYFIATRTIKGFIRGLNQVIGLLPTGEVFFRESHDRPDWLKVLRDILWIYSDRPGALIPQQLEKREAGRIINDWPVNELDVLKGKKREMDEAVKIKTAKPDIPGRTGGFDLVQDSISGAPEIVPAPGKVMMYGWMKLPREVVKAAVKKGLIRPRKDKNLPYEFTEQFEETGTVLTDRQKLMQLLDPVPLSKPSALAFLEHLAYVGSYHRLEGEIESLLLQEPMTGEREAGIEEVAAELKRLRIPERGEQGRSVDIRDAIGGIQKGQYELLLFEGIPYLVRPVAARAMGATALEAARQRFASLGFEVRQFNQEGRSIFALGPFQLFVETREGSELEMQLIREDTLTGKKDWFRDPFRALRVDTIQVPHPDYLTIDNEFGTWIIHQSGNLAFQHKRDRPEQSPYLGEGKLRDSLLYLIRRGGYSIWSYGTLEEPLQYYLATRTVEGRQNEVIGLLNVGEEDGKVFFREKNAYPDWQEQLAQVVKIFSAQVFEEPMAAATLDLGEALPFEPAPSRSIILEQRALITRMLSLSNVGKAPHAWPVNEMDILHPGNIEQLLSPVQYKRSKPFRPQVGGGIVVRGLVMTLPAELVQAGIDRGFIRQTPGERFPYAFTEQFEETEAGITDERKYLRHMDGVVLKKLSALGFLLSKIWLRDFYRMEETLEEELAGEPQDLERQALIKELSRELSELKVPVRGEKTRLVDFNEAIEGIQSEKWNLALFDGIPYLAEVPAGLPGRQAGGRSMGAVPPSVAVTRPPTRWQAFTGALRGVLARLTGVLPEELRVLSKEEEKINAQGPRFEMIGGTGNPEIGKELKERTGLPVLAWDKESGVWSPTRQWISLRFAEKVSEEIVSRAREWKKLARPVRILVIGVGTGLDLLAAYHEAKRRGLQVEIDGTDIQEGALRNTEFNLELRIPDPAERAAVKLHQVERGRPGIEEFRRRMGEKTYDLILWNAPDAMRPDDERFTPLALNTQILEGDLKDILEVSQGLLDPGGIFLLRNIYTLRDRNVIPPGYVEIPPVVEEKRTSASKVFVLGLEGAPFPGISARAGSMGVAEVEVGKKLPAYGRALGRAGPLDEPQLEYLSFKLGFVSRFEGKEEEILAQLAERIPGADLNQIETQLSQFILDRLVQTLRNREERVKQLVRAQRFMNPAVLEGRVEELLSEMLEEAPFLRPSIYSLKEIFTGVLRGVSREMTQAKLLAKEKENRAAVRFIRRREKTPELRAAWNKVREDLRKEMIALVRGLPEGRVKVERLAATMPSAPSRVEEVLLRTLHAAPSNAFGPLMDHSLYLTEGMDGRAQVIENVVKQMRTKNPALVSRIRLHREKLERLPQVFQRMQKALREGESLIFIVPDPALLDDLREAILMALESEAIPEELEFVNADLSEAAVHLARVLRLNDQDRRKTPALEFFSSQYGLATDQDPVTGQIVITFNLMTYLRTLAARQDAIRAARVAA